MSRPAVARTRPNVWWVNQGRTFSLELRGGYLLAPLRDRRGVAPPHWRRMAEVRPRDIVLHYSDGFVRAVSRVQTAPEQAVYPEEDHREYGGRVGNLIRADYHLLDPPVPRDVAASLEHLPSTDGPFMETGSVQQGYIFRFSLDGLVDLVKSFASNWPQWLLEQLNEVENPLLVQYPILKQFLNELRNLRLGVYRGQPLRYKPLMLLAAVRTVVEGFSIALGEGPLLRHYVQFAQAVGVDGLRPEYPYFHLSNEGFWRIFHANGEPFVADNTPSQATLRETYVELADGRDECIAKDELRRYVLGTLRTYFNDDEWTRLTAVWPELATAITPFSMESCRARLPRCAA